MNRTQVRRLVRMNPFAHRRTLGFFYGEKMRAIASIAPDEQFASVLEVGGGTSGLTSTLFPNARVVNVDPDPQAAAWAGESASKTVVVPGLATDLPFGSGSFDCITLFDVLEHVPDDESAAREAMRVLKPGGYVLVSSPSESWRYPYYGPGFRRICYSDKEIMAQWGHVRRGYSAEDLQRLFPECRKLKSASYMNPLTVIAHDISFSRLGNRTKATLILLQYPVTMLGYHLGWPGPRMGFATVMRKAGGCGD